MTSDVDELVIVGKTLARDIWGSLTRGAKVPGKYDDTYDMFNALECATQTGLMVLCCDEEDFMFEHSKAWRLVMPRNVHADNVVGLIGGGLANNQNAGFALIKSTLGYGQRFSTLFVATAVCKGITDLSEHPRRPGVNLMGIAVDYRPNNRFVLRPVF